MSQCEYKHLRPFFFYSNGKVKIATFIFFRFIRVSFDFIKLFFPVPYTLTFLLAMFSQRNELWLFTLFVRGSRSRLFPPPFRTTFNGFSYELFTFALGRIPYKITNLVYISINHFTKIVFLFGKGVLDVNWLFRFSCFFFRSFDVENFFETSLLRNCVVESALGGI